MDAVMRFAVVFLVIPLLLLTPLSAAVSAEPGTLRSTEETGAEDEQAVDVLSPASLPVVLTPSFQERVRFNYPSDRRFDGDLDAAWFIGNRARVGLEAHFGDLLVGLVQLQHLGAWASREGSDTIAGESEESVLANELDVYQLYAEIGTSFGLSARLGRQEISWHGGRLLGAEDWRDAGRSFDAIRLMYDRPDVVGLEALYSRVTERSGSGTDLVEHDGAVHLIAVGGGPRLGDLLLLDGLVIARMDPQAEEILVTFGAYAKGQVGIFRYEAEGYGQAGSRGNQSIGASLVGIRVGVDLPAGTRPYIGCGVDYVSGDSDASDGRIATFDKLYSSRHDFYGHMDVYAALPAEIASQGLVDGQLNLRLTPVRKVAVMLDAHVFAAPSPVESTAAFSGVELDIEVEVELVDFLSIGAGVWTYLPGAFWGEEAKAELGSYLVADFHFD